MFKFTAEMAEHPQSHLVCNLTLFFNLKAKKREMAFVKIVAYAALSIARQSPIHRIQIEWTSLSKKMLGLAWELFLYFVN